jgi:hypothetical protein
MMDESSEEYQNRARYIEYYADMIPYFQRRYADTDDCVFDVWLAISHRHDLQELFDQRLLSREEILTIAKADARLLHMKDTSNFSDMREFMTWLRRHALGRRSYRKPVRGNKERSCDTPLYLIAYAEFYYQHRREFHASHTDYIDPLDLETACRYRRELHRYLNELDRPSLRMIIEADRYLLEAQVRDDTVVLKFVEWLKGHACSEIDGEA